MRLAIAALAAAWILALAGAGQAEPIRIVALGDSNFGAPGVARSDTYPAQLERALRARGLDVVVVNAGINGDTAAGTLTRLDRAVPEGTHVVLLSVGINDVVEHGATQEAAVARVVEIGRRLKARGLVVVNLRTGKEFQGPIKDDPKYHVEGRSGATDATPGRTNWHLTAEGYAMVVARTMPQVLEAITQAKKPAK